MFIIPSKLRPPSKKLNPIALQPVPLDPFDYKTLRMTAVRLASDQQVHVKLSIIKFLCIYAFVLALNLLLTRQFDVTAFNWYLSLAWSSYAPLAFIGLIGALGSRRIKLQKFSDSVQDQVIFLVPTVARYDTVPALMRVIDSILLCAPGVLARFAIHIVTEEGAEGLPDLQAQYKHHKRISFLVVPRAYVTPNGTRYKARANQYALEYRRLHGLNTARTFVYHGDDDTAISHDTIWSIAQFIHKNDADLAQGVLTYPFQLSRSWFCRLADSVRPADDLTRFHFFTGMLRRPMAGLHGEHLLVRANIEEAIGWDFGQHVKVEDAYFGLKFASRYPGRSTFLHSCSYGASPSCVSDLIKQRRRWANGLIGLIFDPQIPLGVKCSLCYSILNWSSGILQHVGFVFLIAFLLGSPTTSPIVQWILYIWCFSLSYQLWMYVEGLRINLDASHTYAKRWMYHILPWLVTLLLPVFSLVETWSATLGVWDFLRKKKGFEVIAKRM